MLGKFVIFSLALIIMAGCAVGNYGPTLWTKYTYTPTATVVEVRVLGLHARTDPFDRGATLGYRNAIYVFPCRHEKVGEEIKLFRVEWPGMNQSGPGNGENQLSGKWLEMNRSIILLNTSYGFEFQLMPEINRFTAGYLNQAITFGPGADESKLVMISLNKDELMKTFLSILSTEEGKNVPKTQC